MEPFFTRTSPSGRTGERMIQEDTDKESSYQQTILLFTHSPSMIKKPLSLLISRHDTGSNCSILICLSYMSTTFQSVGAGGIRLSLLIKRSLRQRIIMKVRIFDASDVALWFILLTRNMSNSSSRYCVQHFEVSWRHCWEKVSQRQHSHQWSILIFHLFTNLSLLGLNKVYYWGRK